MQFYRYEYIEHASLGFDGDYYIPFIPNPKLILRTYELIKETEKGYWIGNNMIYKKWIPKVSKSRFAYPDKNDAKKNFEMRTRRRIKILQHQLDCCEIALHLISI